MRPFARLLACLALALLAPAAGRAQEGAPEIRGVLTEQGGRPIAGARVVLLAGPERLGAALTGPDGGFRLRVPAPGRYTLRAERVGFAAESREVEVGAGPAEVRMAVRVRPVMLEGLAATARPRCRLRQDAGGTPASVLWEEARKALDATAWAQEEGLFVFHVRRHRRLLNAATGAVEREDTARAIVAGERPFRSLPADDLARGGYVRPDGGEFVFYAPDAGVLLSPEFLDGHCFRVVRGTGTRAALAGLAFEPVPGRRLPDVRGTLWLDRQSAELKEMEYRYTGLEGEADDERVGGRQEFERLPGGAWIVRAWSIRMPRVTRERMRLGAQVTDSERITAFEDEGGTVLEIAGAGGGRVRGRVAGGAVEGMVWDSTRASPLGGARVFLSGTSYEALTGPGGTFRIEDIPPGRYAVFFAHPRLDSLGHLPAPREVDVTAEGPAASVALSIPPEGTLRAAACAGSGRPGAVLAGTVRVAATHVPVPGAQVEATWRQGGRERRATATTDGRGAYVLCALPAAADVRVTASALGVRTPAARLRLAAGAPREHSFALDHRPVAARLPGGDMVGTHMPGSVEGRVLAAETERPVAGATVRLVPREGADPRARPQERRTDTRGRFRFPVVVPGEYHVEIEHPSLAASPQTLSVVSRARLDVELTAPGRGGISTP